MRLALRLTVFIAGAGLAASVHAAEIALRPHPVSHGAAVTLGDVFEGLDGPVAATVVARAAPVGLDTVLDAAAVQTVAAHAGVSWSNESGYRRIAVASAPAPSASPRRAAARSRAASALVYARNISAGEILQPSDLVFSSEGASGEDGIQDPDAAIGKAARHALRAGAGAALRDLASPVVIHRDDLVAVTFETDGVSLTLQAKALGEAGVGQVVEIVNTSSKKIIDAVCAGPGLALVGPGADQLKAQSRAPVLPSSSLSR
jgi:flagella basal body P-ring formation protein FlgA